MLISKKDTTMGFMWCFDPIVWKSKFFSFPKELKVFADPVVVIFFEMHLIPCTIIELHLWSFIQSF